MSHDLTLEEMKKAWLGTKKTYLLGFILSLLLTTVAYFFVYQDTLPKVALIWIVIGLALLQAVAQLLFFMHAGGEVKPHWQTVVFLFMVLILTVVVIGSLWIMHDLDMRMMIEMAHHS
ncbi:MAG: cytochrome o ubiquinol oxidase subunit IV [Chlamydiales bacterium]